MSIVSELWSIITEVITGLLSALVASFEGVVTVFWDDETGFTFIGTFLLIALGFTIVFFALRFIRSLIQR